jgi:hypothetical protein
MAEIQTNSIVILDEELDPETQVQVLQKSRDRFFLSLSEAVQACASFATHKNDYSDQVSDLLNILHKWVEGHHSRIRAAHLTIRPRGDLLFIVVQKEHKFDESLSSDLTQLDLDIANDEAYKLITFDVLAIPAVSRESANAFLSSGKVLTHA